MRASDAHAHRLRRPAGPARAAGLAVLLALAAPAAASAQWSPPRTVSSPHLSIGPLEVDSGPFVAYPWQNGTVPGRGLGASAVGLRGEVPAPAGLVGIGRYASTRVLALAQYPVSSTGPQRFVISSSSGSIAGGFGGAPSPLTQAATVGAPQLAVAPNGAALAAWIEIRGARDIVRASYRPVGGRFGRPYTLLGRGQATVLTAAVGSGNDLAIVAQRNGKLIARVRPRHGRWGPVQTLTTARGGTLWQPAAAIDATGHVQAAWRRDQLGRGGFPRRRAVEVASASRRRRFGPVQTLAGDRADPPVLLASPEGWAVAYAQHDAATPAVGVARVHVRRNGDRFGAAVDASPPTAGLGDVSIAADSRSGRLLTGWVAAGAGFAALGPWGGPFAAPAPVTPVEGVSELGFVAAPLAGRFTAAWVSRPPGQALAVVREADGP